MDALKTVLYDEYHKKNNAGKPERNANIANAYNKVLETIQYIENYAEVIEKGILDDSIQDKDGENILKGTPNNVNKKLEAIKTKLLENSVGREQEEKIKKSFSEIEEKQQSIKANMKEIKILFDEYAKANSKEKKFFEGEYKRLEDKMFFCYFFLPIGMVIILIVEIIYGHGRKLDRLDEVSKEKIADLYNLLLIGLTQEKAEISSE